MANEEPHEYWLGVAMNNLLFLDYTMRTFTALKDPNLPNNNKISDYEVGATIQSPLNGFNCRYFGEVVKKFNKEVDKELRIPEWVVDFRNTIAHGFIATMKNTVRNNNRIIRFDYQEKKDLLEVKFAENYSKEWIKARAIKIQKMRENVEQLLTA